MKETVVELVQTIASHLWRASWEGSLLVVAVVGLQWVFRRTLPARWLAALWILVLVRLLLPAVPEISWSPARAWQHSWQPTPLGQRPTAGLPLVDGFLERGVTPFEIPIGRKHVQVTSPRAVSAHAILSGIWLGMAIVLMVRMMVAHRRWTRQALRVRREVPTEVQVLFDAIKTQLRISRADLFVTSAVGTPLVTGLWRARVFLPAGFDKRLPLEDLRMVLWHELGHVTRGDTWLAWLGSLVVSLHWFNPLVHLAMTKARHDREEACDEWVLSRGLEPRSYGAALVRILEFGLPLRCGTVASAVGILETKSALVSRVRRISSYRHASWKSAVGGSVIIAGLALSALTTVAEERSQQLTVEGEGAAKGQNRLAANFRALMDYYEQEAGASLRGNGWLRPGVEGGAGSHDETEMELTNERFQFALQQIPEQLRQGTGSFAPVPAILYEAIEGRNPARVRAYLRTLAVPNLPENNVRNLFEPIDYAVHALIRRPGDPSLREIVKILLEFGANPFSPRIDRRSLLFAPVKNGQVDLVAFLLSVGIDPRNGGDGGVAVMEEAELHGTPAMKSLIQKAFDRSPDAYGASKLW